MANTQTGTVETLDGNVTVTPAGGSAGPLLQGMPVYLNDVISVDGDAHARLRLYDGTALDINAGQTIVLDTNIIDPSAGYIPVADGSVTAITLSGIGVVNFVEGKVQVIRGGLPRDLVAGDALYPGDVVITAADAAASIHMPDGTDTDIGPDNHARLGVSPLSPGESEFLSSGIADPSEIQAAILAGRDPTQDAPAPGVGETDANEGHTHIRILPSDRAVTPESGHETHGQSLPFQQVIEELLQSEDSTPVLTLVGDGAAVDEAALPTGSDAVSPAESASGSFTLDTGGDGIGSLVINNQDVTNGGQVVSPLGTLTVTNTSGVYTWDYLLTTNADHPDATSTGTAEGIEDLFNVVLTDSDGDQVSDVLNITVLDDGPTVSGGNLGEFDEGSGPQIIGPVESVLNITPGADGLQSIDFTSLDSQGGTLEVIDGQLVYTPPADVDNGSYGTDLQLESFQVTVTDGDGDTAVSEVSFEITSPNIIVGSNKDDALNGTNGVDFIAGDSGGTTTTSTNANVILMLDTSGSMRSSINFTDSNGDEMSMSRLAAQKLAVIALLNEMASSDATEVRVHIIEFNRTASSLGTYDLMNGGLQTAISDVNGTVADGVTNYEAAVQQAIDWSGVPDNLLSDGNTVNQAFFVSDGKPNRYLESDGDVSGGVSAATAMSQLLGTDTSGSQQDNTNEVQVLEDQFGPIEAVGIALTRQSDIDNLDQVEGEARSSDAADNIFTANELINTLSDLNPLNQLTAAGDDIINSGDGNDIIFGDSLFTDTLAADQGLPNAPGSGWQVFADLEATPGWGREETTDYIRANHAELAAESTLGSQDRDGGHDIIDAGAGDDIVYGQEGDDTILGGSGNDILSGGSGADTFVWLANESGTDAVTDFNVAEGDVLNIADLLVGENNPTAIELDNTYMSIAPGQDADGLQNTVITLFGDGGNADQVIELIGFDSTGLSSVQIIENLLTAGNLITD